MRTSPSHADPSATAAAGPTKLLPTLNCSVHQEISSYMTTTRRRTSCSENYCSIHHHNTAESFHYCIDVNLLHTTKHLQFSTSCSLHVDRRVYTDVTGLLCKCTRKSWTNCDNLLVVCVCNDKGRVCLCTCGKCSVYVLYICIGAIWILLKMAASIGRCVVIMHCNSARALIKMSSLQEMKTSLPTRND